MYFKRRYKFSVSKTYQDQTRELWWCINLMLSYLRFVIQCIWAITALSHCLTSLSCSTHSDLRWRDDRRTEPDVYCSKAANNKLLPQNLNRWKRLCVVNTPCYPYAKPLHQSLRTLYSGKYKMRIYLITAGQSFGHAATNWHSESYYWHEEMTIFWCL